MNKKRIDEMREKHYVTINGEEIPYHKIDNDINGNPRCVVHFLDLGVKLEDYGKIPKLEKYRAKWFGGGYVTQCWNVQEDLEWSKEQVNKYYSRQDDLK